MLSTLNSPGAWYKFRYDFRSVLINKHVQAAKNLMEMCTKKWYILFTGVSNLWFEKIYYRKLKLVPCIIFSAVPYRSVRDEHQSKWPVETLRKLLLPVVFVSLGAPSRAIYDKEHRCANVIAMSRTSHARLSQLLPHPSVCLFPILSLPLSHTHTHTFFLPSPDILRTLLFHFHLITPIVTFFH